MPTPRERSQRRLCGDENAHLCAALPFPVETVAEGNDPDFDGDAHWRERGPEQLQSFWAKRENSTMPTPTNIPTATSWIASTTLSSRNRGLVKALSRTKHPNSTKAIDAYILGFFIIPKW